MALLFTALPVCAQYPGQVAKSSKDAPELRAIAVLEWIGEAGKPKACRLVPVAVLDGTRLAGDQLQDGSVYLARPEPLALAGEVEYELQQDGKPVGLFDLRNTGHEQGSWVGYGAWKQPPAPRPKPSLDEVARTKIDDEDSDQPVLHRKHHADENPAPAASGGSNGGSSPAAASPTTSDPDQPTLHRKDSASDSPASSSRTASTSVPSSGTASDSDQPTLHRRDASDNDNADATPKGSQTSETKDTKKSRKKNQDDLSHVDSLPDVIDPDRPRLKRGKPSGNGLDVLPTLMGLPPDMRQAVAVSDAKSRPDHPWNFNWANPDDEGKMKSALEDVARTALGLQPPPAPPAPANRRSSSRKSQPAPQAPPAPLLDEDFRVFELAYGSGATLVLSARADASHRAGLVQAKSAPDNLVQPNPTRQKWVTLIAQPDLYGNLLVLLKSVADSADLDDSPRMILVDAVDAMADNRGELLFELRGQTQRQFALYRILRGQAQQLIATGNAEFSVASTNP
ncbi:MAG: hypothetical protein ABR907_10250 [Terracidiphilus sp.]|jgi:hypothetical protein